MRIIKIKISLFSSFRRFATVLNGFFKYLIVLIDFFNRRKNTKLQGECQSILFTELRKYFYILEPGIFVLFTFYKKCVYIVHQPAIGVSLSNLSINPDRGLPFVVVAKSNNLDDPKPHRGSLFVP